MQAKHLIDLFFLVTVLVFVLLHIELFKTLKPICCMDVWMAWIYLRTLLLLEHLAVLKIQQKGAKGFDEFSRKNCFQRIQLGGQVQLQRLAVEFRTNCPLGQNFRPTKVKMK